jgi:beta-ureidopropionase
LKISSGAEKLASANDFVVKSYKIDALKEDLRKPRIVRIGAIQNSLATPTTDPVNVQRDKIFEKVGKLIEAAGAENVNILCLQELWSKCQVKSQLVSYFFHNIFYFLSSFALCFLHT